MGVVMLPLRGLLWVFRQIAEQAERELYDEDGIRAELARAYRELSEGRLGEAEFEQREAELARRLEEAERHNAARRSGR